MAKPPKSRPTTSLKKTESTKTVAPKRASAPKGWLPEAEAPEPGEHSLLKRRSAEPAAPPEPVAEAVPEPGFPTLDSSERRRRVATAAYYRAERRGFVPGFEIEDWLAAELELAAWTTDS